MSNACPHPDRPTPGRVCAHLLENETPDDVEPISGRRFTGQGRTYDLLCPACVKSAGPVETPPSPVCVECFERIESLRLWYRTLGQPETRIVPSRLRFEHEIVEVPGLARLKPLTIQPLESSGDRWLALSSAGELVEIDAARRELRQVALVPRRAFALGRSYMRRGWNRPVKDPRALLRVSPAGDIAVVAQTYGHRGMLIDLETGRMIREIRRDRDARNAIFPLALLRLDDRTVLVHGTGLARVDASDAQTGELLTPRMVTEPPTDRGPLQNRTHLLSSLVVSPDQESIADNGWMSGPFGVVTTWSLRRWLRDNPNECDAGPSRRVLCYRLYLWDAPVCWLEGRRLAVWGFGDSGEEMIPAARIFDASTGEQTHWFPGPNGSFVFDRYLYAFHPEEGMTVWDVDSGERVGAEPGFCPDGYHRGAKQFVTVISDGSLRLSRVISGLNF